MKTTPTTDVKKSKKDKVFGDRKRTNVLKEAEQKALYFLVRKIPGFITSDGLSAIGLAGCAVVLIAFLLATYVDRHFLLLGIAGLIVNWFGDSLDGRLAYYRGIPRKWYGFSLDIVTDWVGTAMIALGYMVYSKGPSELSAFFILFLYGWAMIISQLRYKVTDQYQIDSGFFGPTEVRVFIALMLVLEAFYPDAMMFLVWVLCAILIIVNLIDTAKLLRVGDVRDKRERLAVLEKK